MSEALRALLVLAHVGATVAWLGAMLYSLAVVQPRLERFVADPREREDLLTALAAGARWKVLGLVVVLGASGAALTALELDEADGAWIALVAVKGVLLVAATALFAYVSWRLWPARQLAHALGSPELTRIQTRFRTIALVLTALVAAGLVLGVVAESVR